MEPEFLHSRDGLIVTRVQLDVYGLQPLLTAAHKFTDRAYIHLEQESEGVVICRLRAKRRIDNAETIAGEFLNELLDQRLRERLYKQTEPVRRLLLAQAFSQTNLIKPELDHQAPATDP